MEFKNLITSDYTLVLTKVRIRKPFLIQNQLPPTNYVAKSPQLNSHV